MIDAGSMSLAYTALGSYKVEHVDLDRRIVPPLCSLQVFSDPADIPCNMPMRIHVLVDKAKRMAELM